MSYSLNIHNSSLSYTECFELLEIFGLFTLMILPAIVVGRQILKARFDFKPKPDENNSKDLVVLHFSPDVFRLYQNRGIPTEESVRAGAEFPTRRGMIATWPSPSPLVGFSGPYYWHTGLVAKLKEDVPILFDPAVGLYYSWVPISGVNVHQYTSNNKPIQTSIGLPGMDVPGFNCIPLMKIYLHPFIL